MVSSSSICHTLSVCIVAWMCVHRGLSVCATWLGWACNVAWLCVQCVWCICYWVIYVSYWVIILHMKHTQLTLQTENNCILTLCLSFFICCNFLLLIPFILLFFFQFSFSVNFAPLFSIQVSFCSNSFSCPFLLLRLFLFLLLYQVSWRVWMKWFCTIIIF